MTTGNFSLLVDISRDFLTLWLIHFYVVVEYYRNGKICCFTWGGMICSWGGTRKTANAAIYIRNTLFIPSSPQKESTAPNGPSAQHWISADSEDAFWPLTHPWMNTAVVQRSFTSEAYLCIAGRSRFSLCDSKFDLEWLFFRSRLFVGVHKAHQYYEVNHERLHRGYLSCVNTSVVLYNSQIELKSILYIIFMHDFFIYWT